MGTCTVQESKGSIAIFHIFLPFNSGSMGRIGVWETGKLGRARVGTWVPGGAWVDDVVVLWCGT